MADKLVLPTCPYCGSRVWYVDAFLVKNKPLYKCHMCKGKASVLIKDRAFKILWAVQIFAILIFAAAVLLGGTFSVFGFGLIIILFTSFYVLTPYMVDLKHARIKKEDKFGQKEDTQKTSKEDTATEIYSN